MGEEDEAISAITAICKVSHHDDLVREQLGRHRMGEEDEAVSRRSWSSSEREALVATLEEEREKTGSLKQDMREVLDQKEELVVERDALKSKHERLNKEMNLMLKGD